MKRLPLLLLLLALLPLSVWAQEGPVISFEDVSHNFGTINEGELATHEFVFVNTGTEPVVISDVSRTCGCTTPFWPKEPIMPGDTSSVKATYNSQDRPGRFHKTITVTTNDPKNRMVRLYLRGEVTPED